MSLELVMKDVQRLEAERVERTKARDSREVLLSGGQVRQGDVYLRLIPDDSPKGAPWEGRQVAQGNTKGSRHIANTPAKLFHPAQQHELLGPVVVSDSDWVLSHPEHQDHICPPGTIQVGLQLDPRTKRRVVD